jgi:predicted DNA-binding transcriptional regulator YafY
MAKTDTFVRYTLIVAKLRKHKAGFQEIASYLQSESDNRGYNLNISKRTFQRDINEISKLFDIEIQFNRSEKAYFISNDDSDKNKERIIEALDIFHALNMSDNLSKHIQFENSHSQGTQHLHGLLHAIKNKYTIELGHRKYWDSVASIRTVDPLAIKEFKRRWYLVAYDMKDNIIKVFGLDRIAYFDITTKQFTDYLNFNVNKHFENCFGVIKPLHGKPEKIELSFDHFQGLFIKSLPLHHTQEILKDDDDELRISLKLYITHDFLMELQSYGATVKVIQPASLVKKLKETYNQGLKHYND